jgi:Xaa-Pro aminopeptidase
MEIDLGAADALLISADSDRNQDLYYATRFRAPDPFIFLWTRAGKLLLARDLELDRARLQAQVDIVQAASHYEDKLRQQGVDRPTSHDILLALLQDRGLARLKVPTDFPLATADFLRQSGIVLEVASAPLFAQRQIKTPAEIDALRRAMRATEQGMQTAVEAIGAAEVHDGLLHLDGQVLTSEGLRQRIHLRLMELDCVGQHTIVAGGEQGCDPHQEGSGPLRAGETIIIDIFPRAASGYFGDITRTLVKGQAPPALKALFDVVLRGQQLALERIRSGVPGKDIHQAIKDLFVAEGYETGEKDGYMQGFFHSTGHGLGLEIHEAPSIGPREGLLQKNHVVTVEPGLYYRGLGGVRIEDVVVVQEDGCENLTTFPKYLEVE